MRDSPAGPRPATGAYRYRRVLGSVCWLYLAAVLAVWLVLQRAEEWWPSTVLMFSPRWVFALPLVLLLPAAVFARSPRRVAVLLAAGIVVAWPVMGLNVPWQQVASSTPNGQPFRVMTLNMHYSKAEPASLERLVLAEWPDVVAIQEWSGAERSSLSRDSEWHVHSNSRLTLASRHPIRQAVELGDDSIGERASVMRYELETPQGVVHVFNLHTATMRQGITDTIRDRTKGPVEIQSNTALRRRQLSHVAAHARACIGPVLIVGDFNTPPESPILSELLGGYTDAFSRAGWGWGYTFIGAKTTVRIDHILAGKEWSVTRCRVGPSVGSPHRPVIADLIRTESK